MDPQIAETLQMLIGLSGITIITVSGMAFWLKKKELDKRRDPAFDDTIDALRAEIEELRADHAEQLVELQERVEFAERLLTRGRENEGRD